MYDIKWPSDPTDGSECPGEVGDRIYSIILDVTFYVYMFNCAMMLVVLILVIRKRGNWIAILFVVAFGCAYLIKGLSFKKNWLPTEFSK